jgi:phytoene synthase
MRECAIPPRFAHDLIEGFALDAREWRPRSQDDLMRYCYHVAGSVGCMMAVLMGVDPADDMTLDRACDLGLAFQLANIARDISEDDAADRCYLPMEWLAEMDLPPGEHMKPWARPRLALLGRRLADMAAAYETSARHGTGALPPRAAWAVLAAAGIYGDIAREVARRGEQAWDQRVITPKRDKLGWVARAGLQTVGRAKRWPGEAPRSMDLWRRPR